MRSIACSSATRPRTSRIMLSAESPRKPICREISNSRSVAVLTGCRFPALLALAVLSWALAQTRGGEAVDPIRFEDIAERSGLRFSVRQLGHCREASDRDDDRRSGRLRLQQRRQARHLFRQRRAHPGARKDRPGVSQPAIPQQGRRHVSRTSPPRPASPAKAMAWARPPATTITTASSTCFCPA